MPTPGIDSSEKDQHMSSSGPVEHLIARDIDMATIELLISTPPRRATRRNTPAISQPLPVAPSSYFRWKRGLDCFLAILLLFPVLPLIGLLVGLVRLTSRGPGIYRQVRVGQHGRTFTIYKIRSMTVNAEAGTGAVWAQHNDPRVTLLGGILRKFHLDELPQLFNVLKGDMSLVGPRPERPEFVRLLAEKIPEYADRLAVRPGITGLAQLNLPPDSDLDSVRRKLYLDLEYVRHAGWFLDFRLLLGTSGRFVKFYEPLLMRLLELYRPVPDHVCQKDYARLYG
jgi:lipopolysaccharide/colanic/teichoic acid biosynthesis glycosyltransferase